MGIVTININSNVEISVYVDAKEDDNMVAIYHKAQLAIYEASPTLMHAITELTPKGQLYDQDRITYFKYPCIH